MARQKSPYPSIIHLKILMDMFIQKFDIPRDSAYLSETLFVKKVTEQLVAHGIVQANSQNLVDKLLGYPFYKDEKKAEGIDSDKIEKFAQVVWDLCSLDSIYNRPIPKDLYWYTFTEKLVSFPPHLQHIRGRAYYKYLSAEDRKIVDEFVARKVDELMPPSEGLLHYSMYFWNDTIREIDIAILTIDQKQQVAYVKFTYVVDDKVKTKNVQRTDREGGLFRLSNNTLYLNLVEESTEKQHLRTSFAIAVYDSDYATLTYLKSAYSSSRQNATHPVAGTCILMRQDSYTQAVTAVQSKVPDQIALELYGEHLVVNDDKLRTLYTLSTARVYKQLERIQGFYYLAFYTKGTDYQQITAGICNIEASGRITLKVANLPEVIGYVDGRADVADDIIILKDFYNNQLYHYKYTYTLNLLRDEEKINVIKLAGFYSGITSDNQLRAGKLVMIKEPTLSYQEVLNESSSLFTRFKVTDIAEGTIQAKLCDELQKNDSFII